MQGIKNIIFDLGGVILNIDYQKTNEAFVKLGAVNFHELYSQFKGSSLFNDLETGHVTNDEFLAAMHKQLPENVTDEQIIAAWNAMLLDFPLQRLQLLQQLRQQYNLYLLSNTNAIHLDHFNKILMDTRGIPSLAEFFDKAYYSHLMGYRKPGTEIYQVVLDENGLKAGETVFIDDTLPNIEAAKKVGIHTIHLVPPKTILDIFKPLAV
ncbi:putative hydrolase of the HAD superfamily [Chitinophaga jiangningensis]|uniref:Putative hydrolase of the HAD superfamily n=1 Tax=Chitinophaga jiangningensis TaxID=1419482 RepID=A0A1M7ECP4_9BACT|nr:HAD family phosphatase [Chitinophaga jiangningensis]SHL89430.1 putative hydrolase of the HAD superfamily [Chitinophaga jiangningensis]